MIASAPDDAIVLRPPPPGEAIADVAAAVRDALRFPLAGEPLEALVRRRARATIVIEPPALPLPAAPTDPRQIAVAAVADELERLGIQTGYQTILVTSGLARRTAQRDVESLVTPEFARRFHGRVVVHDAEDPDLVELAVGTRPLLRVNRALVETDVVVTVTAAETVLHGGPATLLAAAGAEAQRAASAYSLLETSASQGWQLGVALERALSTRVPVIGCSVVLNHPTVSGVVYGYPYDPASLERIARSPLRFLFGALPGGIRGQLMRLVPLELTIAAAFAGPPSVAHAEALLRAVELHYTDLDRPLDAIVVGIPRATPYLPRERPNPLLAAYLGLAFALRLWRNSFPVADGGTAVLLHRFHRHFSHPTQQPYRAFFAATRAGPDPDAIAAAERAARTDSRALDAYRAGHGCHPLLPFADWDGCGPQIRHLGSVLIAACRDGAAARQLGFVPTHGVGAALEMATGVAGGPPRIGFLLAPPYFPLRVGG